MFLESLGTVALEMMIMFSRNH